MYKRKSYLKKGFKIELFVLLLLSFSTSEAQTEQGLLPYSNKLLLNPSYAGFGKNTSIWSSLHFFLQPEKKLNNAYTLSYDSWSEKMKGGIAVYFYQGLFGKVNTNVTGTGITLTKPFQMKKSGEFIPSFNLNYYLATKQWFVHLTDEMFKLENEPPSPPGEEFLQFSQVRPQIGLLWNSNSIEAGVSSSISFRNSLVPNAEAPDQSSFHALFHFAYKGNGKRNGLVSQPFKAGPEFIILYSENLILARTGFRIKQTDNLYGIFIQNNFTGKLHGLGGTVGWNFWNFRLNVSAGAEYSLPKQKIATFGEISLGLILPYVHINEKNPWAPPSGSF